MPNSSPSCSSSSEQEGFSFVEVLVSMVLMSILGLSVWSGLTHSQGLVSRTIQISAQTTKALQLATYAQKMALRVRVPYWATGIGNTMTQGTLMIPWLDGQPDDALVLRHDGNLLVMTTLKTPGDVTFGPFGVSAYDVYLDAGGKPAGLQLSVTTDRALGELSILAPFGSIPLSAGAK